ncbi:MAG: SDR family oxidoreductase [Betaproteobacteria bacterium]|nr:SDR family oxidoreductase [Betaproteobacteria bacterium]
MKSLLIVGCGDVATRALALISKSYRLSALTRSEEDVGRLHALGVRATIADLDHPESLNPADFGVDCLLHCAPPPNSGALDTRTSHLLDALASTEKSGAMLPRRVVYLSTSGVYGDCAGAWVDESREPNPGNPRAARRVHAEQVLQAWARERGAGLVILRVPGIYAADRLPLERLRAGTPVLRADEDVYSNHIHAEDLAAIIAAALHTETVSGIFNASDDTEMKMGDYFDLVADRHGLPCPPRIARAQAAARVSPELLSFWGESRRLVNRRMKHELRVQLRYPTVREGVPVLSEAQ